MKILDWLFGADQIRRIAELEGLMAAETKKNQDLTAEVVALQDEKKELMDWIMTQCGAPSLYGREPDRQTSPPTANQHESRMARTRSMREWVQSAEALEQEAFRGVPRG